MKTLTKEESIENAKSNKVPIEKLLTAIHVFHEVICDEYPGAVQDHPYIELYADGSGAVVSQRTLYYNPKKYPRGCLFTFYSLKSLVKEAKRLCKKHEIEWE